MNHLLPLLTFVLALFISGPSVANSADKPNVIILITDDQGYPELSAHGNPVLQTPHLDDLHAQSARLTDFHVAPMCTPTRGQLMTGIDAARNGAINVSSGRTLMRAELPTIADQFQAAGYATGIFGKWHLGDNYPFRPGDRGFQETLWFPSSHINSVPDVWDNDYFGDTYTRNGTLTKYEGYCTDVFFTEAIEWMKQVAEEGEPFFTYLPTNAPHTPYWEPEKYREAMRKSVEEAEAAGKVAFTPRHRREDVIQFLAMIKNIDDNVGRLEEFLESSGLFENTVVVFLTDNGSTLAEHYYPAGMRGKKTQLWEGGHRVPCFVRWPGGGLNEGRDIGGLTQVQDLLPTLATLCDVPVSNSDALNGIDLSPMLRGEESVSEDRKLVINYSRMPGGLDYPTPDSPSIMRRDGAGVLWKRWRLLEDRELYNLDSDPLQTQNIIDRHPEIAAEMSQYLDNWWEEVKDIANEPQRVVIGHKAENPTLLTACEWLDVFIDQQQQIRRADLKNSYWELDVHEPGQYEFEMRRWPRDADLAISANAPETIIADGVLPEGMALDIKRARLRIAGNNRIVRLKPGQKSATVRVNLEEGPTRLYTWFDDERNQPIVGAYYVYVKKLTAPE